MKRFHKISSLIFVSLLLASCGNNSEEKKSEITLDRISLSGDYQTVFEVGDEFNYEGLIVTAFYSDDSSSVVTPTSVSTPDMSSEGEKEITVTYQTVSTKYTITINPVSVTLSSISVSDAQTVFTVGDDFVKPTVTAHYSDDSEADVTSSTSFSGYDMLVAGDYLVTASYTEGDVTKTADYEITVSAEPEEEFEGYMYFAMYRLDIELNDNTRHHLLPRVVDKDGKDVDVGDLPFRFELSNPDIITVSRSGGINSKKTSTGICIVTCYYTENEKISAKCTVNVVDKLPTKEKGWVRLDDYDSLKDGDVLVMAAPSYGLTASLDTLHSKLHPVESTFSSDLKTIASLGDGTIEFVLGVEEKGMTLESQTGEYLKCTHEGKVSLDSSTKTNRYWDIHSNVDPETGEGSLADGAVIENNVESLGYFMFNVVLNYFTTYVDNSLRPGIMELPFLYRLEELD